MLCICAFSLTTLIHKSNNTVTKIKLHCLICACHLFIVLFSALEQTDCMLYMFLVPAGLFECSCKQSA